jgi:hypothetical protein
MIKVASLYDEQPPNSQEAFQEHLRNYHKPETLLDNWDPSQPYRGGISLNELLSHLPAGNRHPNYCYKDYFESKYAGLCTAMIYNGYIDEDELQQNFALGFESYS